MVIIIVAAAAAALIAIALIWTYSLFAMACKRGKTVDINDENAVLNAVKTSVYREDYQRLKESIRFIEDNKTETLSVKSEDGTVLCAEYVPAAVPTKKFVIFFHGYRSLPHFDLTFILDRYADCNLALVYQRAHGKSGGKYITYGVKERHDALTWCNYLTKRFGSDICICMHGISMGAMTVLSATELPLPKTVKCVIADCGFTTPRAIFYSILKRRAPIGKGLTLWLFNMWCKAIASFDVDGASAPAAMEKNELPILFTHGNKDDFVPIEMTKETYAACRAPRDLIIIENAGHAECNRFGGEEIARHTKILFDKYMN